MHRKSLLPLIITALFIAGCSQAAPSSTRVPDSPAAPARSTPPKSLSIAVAGEPTHIVFDFGSSGFGSVGNADLTPALHHGLTSYDDRGAAFPLLATAIPSRDNGSWLVRSDG